MSIYIFFITFLIFVGVITELSQKSLKDILFKICSFFMGCILIFRYGQGTDYFTYNYLYNQIGDANSIQQLFELPIHGEGLWKIINYFFNKLGFSFEIFAMLISVFCFLSLIYAINKYVENYKILSLILSYPTVFLVYYMSAIRQGIVLGIFFSVLLNNFFQKRYFKYILIVIVCSFIHTSALVLLLLLIVPMLNKRIYNIIFIISISISLVLILNNGILDTINRSSMQFLERAVMLIIIYYLYQNSKNTNYTIKIFYNIYRLGFFVYLFFLSNHLLAARGTVYFKALELFIIPNLLYENNNLFDKAKIYLLVCMLIMFLTLKGISSFLVDGQYYTDNIFDYHYVSIFNSDDIHKYRSSNFYFNIID